MLRPPFRSFRGLYAPEHLIRLILALPPSDSPHYTEQDISKWAFVNIYLRQEMPSAGLLETYMYFLDRHFFFGHLCNTVRLKVFQEDTNRSDMYGFFDPNEGEIGVFLHHRGNILSLNEALDTLIHQMTLACICIFSSQQLASDPLQLDIHGGHGMYWNILFHSIVNRVRGWHPSLEALRTRVWLTPSQRLEILGNPQLGHVTDLFTKLEL
ncbi:hypothetical protein F4810DRAFT_678621 [Camillea tinctor]|nr:hypothetical protein F4810DRAFT_678621 [Camillea tinctor]